MKNVEKLAEKGLRSDGSVRDAQALETYSNFFQNGECARHSERSVGRECGPDDRQHEACSGARDLLRGCQPRELCDDCDEAC